MINKLFSTNQDEIPSRYSVVLAKQKLFDVILRSGFHLFAFYRPPHQTDPSGSLVSKRVASMLSRQVQKETHSFHFRSMIVRAKWTIEA
jgi:hypothetical protein